MSDEQHNPNNPEQDDDARIATCDWLCANGVDPRVTPADPHASVVDGQLTILQKVQRDGHDVIAPDEPWHIMTETITVPVVVEPTGLVATWLAPRCPTCGR